MRDLLSLLKNIKNCSFCGAEIGVLKGDNAQEILNNLTIDYLVLVDPWIPYPIKDLDEELIKSHKNSKEYMDFCKEKVYKRFEEKDNVIIINNTSEEATKFIEDLSLDFVYIDAKHYYNNVLQDCNLWYPKIKFNGFLAGHDINHERYGKDVQAAVSYFCYKNNLRYYFGDEDWIVTKQL